LKGKKDMNIRSLATGSLVNTTLMNSIQTNGTNSSNLASNSFASLLTEALLQAELSTMTSSPQDGSASLLNGLNLLENLLGIDPSNDSTSITNSLSSIGNGGTTLSGNTLQDNDVTPLDLNPHLKGALQNAGHLFVEAGKMYQINPALLASIAIHETGNGTSYAALYKNNIAGMMGKNGLKTYASIQESVYDMARNLRNNYLNEGKTTIAQIGSKYAPIGAANDPNQLNNNWVNGVQHYFDTLTKKADFA
jgi:hypothetical protein